MKIAFRVDSSVLIGSGHVSRCLSIAEVLSQKGAECIFFCQELEGNHISVIREKGFRVVSLSENNMQQSLMNLYQSWDALVLDHYELGKDWEIQVRKNVKYLLVIDDLAAKEHDCDALVSPTTLDAGLRYQGKVSKETQMFLGPRFALINPRFSETRLSLKMKENENSEISNLHVFFGGGDHTELFANVLQALEHFPQYDWDIHLVLGSSKKVDLKMFSRPRVHFYENVSDMGALFSKCQVAIGAGGTSVWERACLGVPSLTVSVADNQQQICEELHSLQVIQYLGKSEDLTVEGWITELKRNLGDQELLQNLRKNSLALVDGKGAERVANLILSRATA